ncbi:putative transcriptional elongation protein Spt4 [Aspergillus steynii IBT 23096]|uniref:Transcription elongation factor SPT4 n=1 Tax=Aspergillus steynii IBT 23096 TaxID=1392250 RepID=A0A2I2FRE7_9EURO|nr:putative transcriptional elongation protein Spt4 [Aspergillus steynii IBT 23096]PLB43179.1 putative transcriptional elongation protein Spt4 [Aspergillus steynii IBT 23096]
MSYYVAPSQQRTLRACMVCSLVQLHNRRLAPRPPSHRISKLTRTPRSSLQKFMREGCPNCDNVLGLRGNNDAIQECTSQVFEGLVTLRDPTTSWVARWQRLDAYVPGTYAVKVTGSLPDEIIASLEDSGVKYIPRDGSTGEEET